jgi:hypothetical protein
MPRTDHFSVVGALTERSTARRDETCWKSARRSEGPRRVKQRSRMDITWVMLLASSFLLASEPRSFAASPDHFESRYASRITHHASLTLAAPGPARRSHCRPHLLERRSRPIRRPPLFMLFFLARHVLGTWRRINRFLQHQHWSLCVRLELLPRPRHRPRHRLIPIRLRLLVF